MKASQRPANQFIKLLYIGDSSTGKTGSLVSLVRAGYSLRILDMDNGIDTLLSYVHKECPDKIDSIDVMAFRDKMKADRMNGMVLDGQPKAYTQALGALNKWDDDSVPAQWGPKTILVIDSLTALSRAAFYWAQGLNPTSKDPRQWYAAAQDSIKRVLELLTSPDFGTNVIVISHVQLVEMPDGRMRGYATSIGKAMGPEIPKYFNTLILAESRGSGENVKRTIQTMPTALIDLKVANPAMPKSLPLETGMAEIFKQL